MSEYIKARQSNYKANRDTIHNEIALKSENDYYSIKWEIPIVSGILNKRDQKKWQVLLYQASILINTVRAVMKHWVNAQRTLGEAHDLMDAAIEQLQLLEVQGPEIYKMAKLDKIVKNEIIKPMNEIVPPVTETEADIQVVNDELKYILELLVEFRDGVNQKLSGSQAAATMSYDTALKSFNQFKQRVVEIYGY